MSDSLILMEGIDKTFPGVHALSQAHFELYPGEVHALVGENGAGKSTLMKVLAGIYAKDSGRILVKGQPVEIHTPRAAQHLGISMIHQELNLMNHLTVAQNIFIGREPRQRLKFMLNEKQINSQALHYLNMLHLTIDPRTKVSELTVAKQQMVEIAKALSFNSDVLIMDEPTAALTDSEIAELFTIIRSLRQKGVGIVYISHRLEELKQISDRITVMRDGCTIDTVNTPDATIEQIISMMVGRTIFQQAPDVPNSDSSPIMLEVRNLNRGKVLKNINFHVKAGEIVGFAGLMGAGRTEVARAVFGADPIDTGEIFVDGHKVHIHHPADAVQVGIGYLSEDRKRYGLTLGMDVETNVVMAAFRDFLGRLGIIVQRDKTRKAAEHAVQMLSIRTPSLSQKVKNLSGGNQQKIVIAKWLTAETKVLIFDEPTRGIDVGAKSEIHKLLNDLARQGKSIIMISSELPEILRMSHRVIVMCEGRISGELNIADATQEKIMYYATLRDDAARDEAGRSEQVNSPA